MCLCFRIFDYKEEDGSWENFGGYPTLVSFDYDNLKNNKGNILSFLEYHKFHLHGVSEIIDYSLIPISQGSHNEGIVGAYLYQYLLLCDLQDYILKDEYKVKKIRDKNTFRYCVEIPIKDTDAWYKKTTEKYDAFRKDLAEKGLTIEIWIHKKKYDWYLSKIHFNNFPMESYKGELNYYKSVLTKFVSDINNVL